MSRRIIIDVDDTPKSERDPSKPHDVITIVDDEENEDQERKQPRRRETFIDKMVRKRRHE